MKKALERLRGTEDSLMRKIFKTPSLFSMGFVKVAKKSTNHGNRTAKRTMPWHKGYQISEMDSGSSSWRWQRISCSHIEGKVQENSKLKLAKSKKTVVSIQIAFNEWK